MHKLFKKLLNKRGLFGVDDALLCTAGIAFVIGAASIIYTTVVNPDWTPHSPENWHESPNWTLSGQDLRGTNVNGYKEDVDSQAFFNTSEKTVGSVQSGPTVAYSGSAAAVLGRDWKI